MKYNYQSAFITQFKTSRRTNQYQYGYANENEVKEVSRKSLQNLNHGQKRKEQISKATARKITKRAFILGLTSDEKTEKDKKGNRHKYKLKFITLTISGDCPYNVTESNKVLLNTFLQDMRRNCNMQNYIWRLEHQKNGKIHYHIITDAAINYHYARHVWNRIQLGAGTMDAFSEKFGSMDFNEYVDHMAQYFDGKPDFGKLSKWYAKGKREKWQNPNSVDVARVQEERQLFYYIAKYITKNDDCNDLTGRVWGCSTELSTAADYDHALQNVLEFAYYKTVEHNHCEEIEMDYCNIVFAKWERLFAWYPFIKTEMRKVYAEIGLKPSEPIQGALNLLGGAPT